MLRSRFDTIARTLEEQMEAVERETAQAIAAGAAMRAPKGATGDLAAGYEAKKSKDGWAVMALWRWFFTEFGTTQSPAQPHLVPAVEADRGNIDRRVKTALKDL